MLTILIFSLLGLLLGLKFKSKGRTERAILVILSASTLGFFGVLLAFAGTALAPTEKVLVDEKSLLPVEIFGQKFFLTEVSGTRSETYLLYYGENDVVKSKKISLKQKDIKEAPAWGFFREYREEISSNAWYRLFIIPALAKARSYEVFLPPNSILK